MSLNHAAYAFYVVFCESVAAACKRLGPVANRAGRSVISVQCPAIFYRLGWGKVTALWDNPTPCTFSF